MVLCLHQSYQLGIILFILHFFFSFFTGFPKHNSFPYNTGKGNALPSRLIQHRHTQTARDGVSARAQTSVGLGVVVLMAFKQIQNRTQIYLYNTKLQQKDYE